MGMSNKPIFGTKWYTSKKPPSLQIKILRLITLQGQMSKRKATKILSSNYSDVSDAMDALAANDKQFIKLSHEKKSTRRPEKFYKITEKGLRALLVINMNSKESIIINSMVFWRLILLLSICSKQPVSYEELDNYYAQFEKNSLGHSALYGYFLQSYFFEIALNNLLQNISKDAATQKVIECLAINGSITLEDLSIKTDLKEDEIIVILQNLTVQIAPPIISDTSPESKVSSNFDVQKQYYTNFISHAIIDKTGNTYGLSLFGVMLIISLIRYYYIQTGSNRPQNLDSTAIKKPVLFYKDQFHNDKKPNEYYDIIARNYRDKLPLIFGKWNFLQDQLASYLYDSFDFLIYKKGRSKSTADSIWIGGNKEFYEDIQALASNTRYHLSPLYSSGKTTLDLFQRFRGWKRSCIDRNLILPLRQKLSEIETIINADIPLTKSTDKNRFEFANEPESQRLYRLQTIETIFAEELTFLFYLNLNTIAFSGTMQHPNESRPSQLSQLETEQWVAEQNQEFKIMSKLGSPRDRLMAILTEDKEIKEWFTERIEDIKHYREQTMNKMSEFYDKILDSHRYVKKKQNEPIVQNSEEEGMDLYLWEYDMKKICSDFNR